MPPDTLIDVPSFFRPANLHVRFRFPVLSPLPGLLPMQTSFSLFFNRYRDASNELLPFWLILVPLFTLCDFTPGYFLWYS